jgi:hypothetical protein
MIKKHIYNQIFGITIKKPINDQKNVLIIQNY